MLISSYHRKKSLNLKIQERLKWIRFLKDLKVNKEFFLLLFFVFLFLILIVRLFVLQVVDHNNYEQLLNQQHASEIQLTAKRWNIFADDKADKHIQLTDNITLYNVFVDPKFVWDKKSFIDIITPVVYRHFCEIYGMREMTKIDCIKNIEWFTQRQILPVKPQFFYFGSWIVSSGYSIFDKTWYNLQLSQIVSWFTIDIANSMIKSRLDQLIFIGIKPENYLWFFANKSFIEELRKLSLDYIDIKLDNYVYVIPNRIGNINRESLSLKKLLDRYGYLSNIPNINNVFVSQENRYVKIISDSNPLIAQDVKNLILKYYKKQSSDKIPLLHWLWLESYAKRYYQYGAFLSNVLWFVDKNRTAFYGIEQFFDNILHGKDGKIIWRASSWIWPVWANEFEMDQVVNWNDIYLTIDVWIQKEIETILKKYQEMFRADSISVLVYNPFNWQIKASANYPSYNPNDYNEVYQYQPLSPEYSYLVDDLTYIDIPIYINTWWEFKLAKSFERSDPTIAKYISKNIYWPQVLVDKNTAMAYEPWSVFKAFTVSIWLDTDEIRFYDFYNDPGKVKVWQYTIKNAESECMWDWPFLHAFVYSCNVGMIRIAQKIWKDIFYNYLDKLWFGKLTNIELANEDEWYVESVTSVSDARFYNNVFGQWLLTTPLQLAAWYGAILNGWYYVQPTIIKWIFDAKSNTYYPNHTKIIKQIFRPETSEALREWLFNVLDQNPELKYGKIPWYKLGGKTGTSQISYKWKYMQGIGRTNWSFVGVITKDDPQYVVVIQIRRPRNSVWWWLTAWKVFGEIARFLLSYSLIENNNWTWAVQK